MRGKRVALLIVIVMTVVLILVFVCDGFRSVGEEFVTAVFAAKVKCVAVSVGLEGRRFIHRHTANGVFGHLMLSLCRSQSVDSQAYSFNGVRQELAPDWQDEDRKEKELKFKIGEFEISDL